jgi:hypothetical protein
MAHPFVQGDQGRRPDEAKAVMAKMKEVPINDFMTRPYPRGRPGDP